MQKRRPKKRFNQASSTKQAWFLLWKPIYFLCLILIFFGIGLYVKLNHPVFYDKLTKPVRRAKQPGMATDGRIAEGKQQWHYLQLLENEEPCFTKPSPFKAIVHYHLKCCCKPSSPQGLESYRAQLALRGIETTWSMRAKTPELLFKKSYSTKQSAQQMLRQLKIQFPHLEFYIVSTPDEP